MIKETYYVSQIDNRLYYIKDARVKIKPQSYRVMHIFKDNRVEEVSKLFEFKDIGRISGLKMDERLYFVSKFDNLAHNIEDWCHQELSENEAYIGQDFDVDGFRVEETVRMWTLRELLEFIGQRKR